MREMIEELEELSKQNPTLEQMNALASFIKSYGKYWKSKLKEFFGLNF